MRVIISKLTIYLILKINLFLFYYIPDFQSVQHFAIHLQLIRLISLAQLSSVSTCFGLCVSGHVIVYSDTSFRLDFIPSASPIRDLSYFFFQVLLFENILIVIKIFFRTFLFKYHHIFIVKYRFASLDRVSLVQKYARTAVAQCHDLITL